MEENVIRIIITFGNECYNEAIKMMEEGALYSALEKVEEAKAYYKKANIDKDIKDCQWLIRHISCLISEQERVEEMWQEADEQYDKGVNYYNLGMNDSAEECLEKAGLLYHKLKVYNRENACNYMLNLMDKKHSFKEDEQSSANGYGCDNEV